LRFEKIGGACKSLWLPECIAELKKRTHVKHEKAKGYERRMNRKKNASKKEKNSE